MTRLDPIVTRDLVVRRGRTVALDRVDLVLEPGTSTALMGANGSGKTTLLDCLAGLLAPSAGRVDATGHVIGYVGQHQPRGWMPLTAGEVVTMGRYGRRGLLGRLRSGDRAAIRSAARTMDVEDLLGRQFGELSGGQRQRVIVARALSAEPTALLLDEPLTGVDLPSQERILEVVADEADRGRIVVMSTHHLDEARHCDRTVLLAGRVVAVGPPDQVLITDHLRTAFAGRTLGDHRDHDHEDALLVLDDHGHDDR